MIVPLNLRDSDIHAISFALESTLPRGTNSLEPRESKTCLTHALSCDISLTQGRHSGAS